MRKLSIPYTKDNKILDILGDNAKYIKEIFMPLPYDIFGSGRPYNNDELDEYKLIMDKQIERAKSLGLEVSMLATKVILDADTGISMINRASRELIRLRETYAIDKVVISNLAYLKHHGEYLKSYGIKIEVSVMADIDTYEKVDQLMVLYPFIDSICLHNDFIFNLDEIKYIKQTYPNLQLKLLANHGCLVNCVSHIQHHNLLSRITPKFDKDDTEAWRMSGNMDILNSGTKICTRCTMANNFNPIKDTSCIRPEDLKYYDKYIDLFKISGREKPAEAFKVIIKAYGERMYDGNLIDLLDIPHMMPYVDNTKFPDNFVEHKLNCNHKCYKCGYCDRISKDIIKIE